MLYWSGAKIGELSFTSMTLTETRVEAERPPLSIAEIILGDGYGKFVLHSLQILSSMRHKCGYLTPPEIMRL